MGHGQVPFEGGRSARDDVGATTGGCPDDGAVDGMDDLATHYDHVNLDAFVVMPDHVHGIIVLADEDGVGAGLKPTPYVSS